MDSSHEPLVWTVHPAGERRRAAVMASLVIFALAWLTYALMNSLLWGAFAVVVLAGGLNRFFLPTRFQIDADGVTAHYPWKRVHYRWGEIRRFLHDSQSGYISRRRQASLLDNYSGIHLLFAGNREAVVARIKQGVAEAAPAGAPPAEAPSERRDDQSPRPARPALGEAVPVPTQREAS